MRDIELIKSKLIDLKCSDNFIFNVIDNIDAQLKLLDTLQNTLYSTELYLIYKHTSPDGKVYIGITKNLPNARWNEGAGYETQKKFYKAIQTFGWINFKHEIIAAGLSESDAKKMESELILSHRSNEEAFGYNTQVLSNVKEEKEECSGQQKNTSVNYTELASKIVSGYSIKTVNGIIYYLKEDKYVKEKENPFIQKELLLAYHIESRKQKEIIEQIKILSAAKKSEVFPNLIAENSGVDNSPLVEFDSFMKQLVFAKSNGYFLSDDALYEKYLLWSEQIGGYPMSKTEFRHKCVSFMKKYRRDIQRIASQSGNGWELKSIVLDESKGNVITERGMQAITEWLEHTTEKYICVQMICEEALGMEGKVSRKLGNEICFALRNIIPGWYDVGVVRTARYGNQMCFVRR